jgi:hypothetical protein
MIDWNKLIPERNDWVKHNFPNPHIPNPGESVLGCMEELGELVHALLKAAQNIRGTAAEHEADAKDAVGDLSVYLMGVMSYCGHAADESRSFATGSTFNLGYWVGRLAQTYDNKDLPGAFSLESKYIAPIDNIVHCLRLLCQSNGWNYDQLVNDTWAAVKRRDWIKYPKDGLVA